MRVHLLSVLAVLHSFGSVSCGLFYDAVAESASRNQQWTKIAPPKVERTERAKSWACTLGTKAYFFGGEVTLSDDTDVVLGDFWVFDFETLLFTEVIATGTTPPPREKLRLVCDAKRNVVYLVAGKPMNDMWVYSPVSNTWREFPEDLVRGPSYSMFGSDFVAMSTTDQIVLAGTNDGEFSDYAVFDKDTETWRDKGYDSRLKVEDPGGVGVGDLAILSGGTFAGSVLPNRTYVINASDPNGLWEDLVTDGMAGEEFKMLDLGNNKVALFGDPGGKGTLGAENGIAILDLDAPRPLHWSIVQQYNRSEWCPLMSDFVAVSYNGTVVVMVGTAAFGNEVSPNFDVWVWNPAVCPLGCSGNGRCVAGNCVDCRGHSGAACEIADPEAMDYTGIIVGCVVGGVLCFLLISGLLWKTTAKSRAFRALYDTNRVAENMAEQIARMELQELDYLIRLENPSRVQMSFITIVKTLQTYKMYLPDSVLQTMQTRGETEDEEVSRRSCSSQDRSSAHGHTTRSSVSSQSGVPANTAAHVAQDLAARLQKKQVATCTFFLPTYVSWIAEHGGKGSMRNIHEVVATFADKVYSTVSSLRGTILDPQLGSGCIVAAWNFQMQKASPEVAAADAALEVGLSLAEKFPLKVHCAVTSGPCWAGNLGGSHNRAPAMVGKQHYITDVLSKMGAAKDIQYVTNLELLADFFNIVPCDVLTGMACASRGGTVYNVPSGIQTHVWAFSILGKLSGGAQEWMYELEETKNSISDLLQVMRLYDEQGREPAAALFKSVVQSMEDRRKTELKCLAEALRIEGN